MWTSRPLHPPPPRDAITIEDALPARRGSAPLNTRLDTLYAIAGLAAVDLLFTVGGLGLLLRRVDRQRVRCDTGATVSLNGMNVTAAADRDMPRFVGLDGSSVFDTQSALDRKVGRAAAAIDAAVCWYPRHAECLPRAVVMTHMLRAWGVPAALVIGIRQIPFYAHAWVEVHGTVVGDADDVGRRYPEIQRCEPTAR